LWASAKNAEADSAQKAIVNEESRSAVDKKNNWRNRFKKWFEGASDGDSITEVTGQKYIVIEKTRRDGKPVKALVAVDENNTPLPDGRGVTGINKVGDRLSGFNDGSFDEDNGSQKPESSPQSLAAGFGQMLENGEART